MLLATLERAAHLIGTHIERTAVGLGITQAEAHVLAQVGDKGPTPIATLRREFGRKPSTLTNVLDRLEERGFVLRELNPDDRRSFVIRLTPAGKRAARRVTQVLNALEREVRSDVSERDVRGVEDIVRALAARVPLDGSATHLTSNLIDTAGVAVRSRHRPPRRVVNRSRIAT